MGNTSSSSSSSSSRGAPSNSLSGSLSGSHSTPTPSGGRGAPGRGPPLASSSASGTYTYTYTTTTGAGDEFSFSEIYPHSPAPALGMGTGGGATATTTTTATTTGATAVKAMMQVAAEGQQPRPAVVAAALHSSCSSSCSSSSSTGGSSTASGGDGGGGGGAAAGTETAAVGVMSPAVRAKRKEPVAGMDAIVEGSDEQSQSHDRSRSMSRADSGRVDTGKEVKGGGDEDGSAAGDIDTTDNAGEQQQVEKRMSRAEHLEEQQRQLQAEAAAAPTSNTVLDASHALVQHILNSFAEHFRAGLGEAMMADYRDRKAERLRMRAERRQLEAQGKDTWHLDTKLRKRLQVRTVRRNFTGKPLLPISVDSTSNRRRSSIKKLVSKRYRAHLARKQLLQQAAIEAATPVGPNATSGTQGSDGARKISGERSRSRDRTSVRLERVRARGYPELRLDGSVPLNSKPIKAGMLQKQGGRHKTWHGRYFVILGRADNYEIEYYEREDGELRGVIQCSGYRVYKLTEHEARIYGPYGIALRPLSPSCQSVDTLRRAWRFMASSEQDRRSWMDAFEIACARSEPIRNEADTDTSGLIRAAYEYAYTRTRTQFGVLSPWAWTVGEPELLASLITQVVARDIFRGDSDFLNGQPEEVKAVYTIIATSPTATTWQTTASTAHFVTDHFASEVIRRVSRARTRAASLAIPLPDMEAIKAAQESAEACIEEEEEQEEELDEATSSFKMIVEEENMLRDRIRSTILESIVQPNLQHVSRLTLVPVLEASAGPLTGVYVAAFHGLVDDMLDRADRLRVAAQHVRDEVKYGMDLDCFARSTIRERSTIALDAFYDHVLVPLARARHIPVRGLVTPTSILTCVAEDVELFLQMAHWTWRQKIEASTIQDDSSVRAVDKCLRAVLRDAVPDMRVWVEKRLLLILEGILAPTLRSAVVPSALGATVALGQSLEENIRPKIAVAYNVDICIAEATKQHLQELLATRASIFSVAEAECVQYYRARTKDSHGR